MMRVIRMTRAYRQEHEADTKRGVILTLADCGSIVGPHKQVGPRRANDRPRGTEGTSFGAPDTLAGAFLARASTSEPPRQGGTMTNEATGEALSEQGRELAAKIGASDDRR